MQRIFIRMVMLAAAIVPPALCGDGPVHARKTWDAEHASGNSGGRGGSTPQILYHGGPIMLGTNTLYIIYYGSFPSGPNNTPGIVNGFFANIGGSKNYDVNTTYYDGGGNHIINSLAFDATANTTYDNYSIGTNIGHDGIEKIVVNALQNKRLPVSTTAIYSVITSPDVTGSEINNLCAFHGALSYNGQVIIYAALPDFGGKALSYCSGNIAAYHDSTSPNNNIGADMVLDSFMHELSESVTDPRINAWYTNNGEEVGDLCNFNYGTVITAPNGSHANTILNGVYYLVQTIWENTGAGFCANGL